MSRVLIALGCMTMLAACQPGSGQTAGQPSASSLRAVSPAPSASSIPPPSAGPGFQVATVTFSCRLPVLTANMDTATFRGGFVTFPGGTYEGDPNGVIQGIGDGDLATKAQPVLFGHAETGQPFYDLAMKRWLPVGSGQASPDGSSYAYLIQPLPNTGSEADELNVVTVASGAVRTLTVNPPPAGAAVGWQLADFDGRAAYLVGQQVDNRSSGVWRLNTATGTLEELVRPGHGVFLVRGGYAWSGWTNSADPSPPIAPKGVAYNSIERVSLATGTAVDWIYRPGQSVALLGVDDAGRPLVSVASGPDFDVSHGTLLLLASPGAAGVELANGGVPLFSMQGDVDRIWFGTDRGIYLWTPTGGLQYVFASGQSITPAGHCA